MVTSLASPTEEAIRVLEAAEKQRVVLRLLGGAAIYLRCPSARRSEFARHYSDLDFMGHSKQTAGIKRLFGELGYAARERFNAIHGGRRLLFMDESRRRRVDVFLDVFEMCHRFEMKERMEIEPQTLTLADLLATKLQVVQTNEKDIGDAVCLLLDHEVGDTDASDMINGQYLVRLCGEDWGIYKTFTMKLAMLSAAMENWELSDLERESVRRRIERLRGAIEKAPKSIGWKMRAAIGERVRWYELPEDEARLEQVPSRGS